jgi:hypothetical protein
MWGIEALDMAQDKPARPRGAVFGVAAANVASGVASASGALRAASLWLLRTKAPVVSTHFHCYRDLVAGCRRI